MDQQLPRGGDAGRAADAVRRVQAERDRAGAGPGGDGDVHGDEVGQLEAELGARSPEPGAKGAACGPPLSFGSESSRNHSVFDGQSNGFVYCESDWMAAFVGGVGLGGGESISFWASLRVVEGGFRAIRLIG